MLSDAAPCGTVALGLTLGIAQLTSSLRLQGYLAYKKTRLR